jgi:hypothetical protein
MSESIPLPCRQNSRGGARSNAASASLRTSTTACDSWASRPPSPAATASSCGRYATNASVAAPPPPLLDAGEEAADDRSAAVRDGWGEGFGAAADLGT